MTLSINFSSRSTSLDLQRNLESVIEKRTKDTYGPPMGRKLVCFIDDLNMPQVSQSFILLYFSIVLHCIVQWVLQVMFPSACRFIVLVFTVFTTCFGLHGHLQVCRIFYFHMLQGFCFVDFFFLFFMWSHSACFPSVEWVKYEILLFAVYAIFSTVIKTVDCLCGLVVRVLGYRSRGPNSIRGATRMSEK
jgi:hypothetical protein